MPTNTSLSRLQATRLLAQLVLPKTSLINRLKFFFRPLILPIPQLFSLLPDGGSVFDIGCGQGQLLALITKFKTPQKILGVEIDSKLVSNANYVLSPLFPENPNPVEVFDGLCLPTSARHFSHWFLVDVLHHIPSNKRLAFFASLRKNMNKNTTLIVKDIAAQKIILTWFNKLHDWLLSGSPGHEISTDQFSQLMIHSGFKVGKITYSRVLWYPHFIALCYPV
jgi:SAM-dependent methyltransferase